MAAQRLVVIATLLQPIKFSTHVAIEAQTIMSEVSQMSLDMRQAELCSGSAKGATQPDLTLHVDRQAHF